MRKGYAFNGWNDTVEVMPAHDVTIAATWKKEKKKSGFPLWSILLIVLGVVVIVAIVVVIVVCVLKNKKKNQYYDLRTPINPN